MNLFQAAGSWLPGTAQSSIGNHDRHSAIQSISNQQSAIVNQQFN